MDKQEALASVCSYADRHADEIEDHDGLTYEKINRRGEIDEDESRPDRIVFEVERHMAILGCTYYPGEPMDSYVTYWQRFEFHPATQVLTPLPESRKRTVEVDVDRRAEDSVDQMFGFDFRPNDAGGFVCTESSCNSEKIVQDIGDVHEFAMECVRGLRLDEELEGISDCLSAGEADRILSDLVDAYIVAATDKAESAWNDFSEDLVKGDYTK